MVISGLLKRIFTTETQSSQRLESFLIKNSLLCVLGASAVQSPSPASQENLKTQINEQRRVL
jgi:hypothetical protein